MFCARIRTEPSCGRCGVLEHCRRISEDRREVGQMTRPNLQEAGRVHEGGEDGGGGRSGEQGEREKISACVARNKCLGECE